MWILHRTFSILWDMETRNLLKDKDIREPLFTYLEERYGKVRIFEEKNIGMNSRADVFLVLEDRLVGIEIKSDADSYTRLAGQVEDYDRCFDENIVVVGSTHGAHIEQHVPMHWGILTVEQDENGRCDFYILREPQKNPNLKMTEKIRLLWRPELANIQARHDLFKYPGKSKLFVQEYLIKTLEPDLLHREISHELFERDYTKIHDTINEYRTAHGAKPRRRRKRRKRKKRTTA